MINNINEWKWEKNDDKSIIIEMDKFIIDNDKFENIISIPWRIELSKSIGGKVKTIHQIIYSRKRETIKDNNIIDHIDGNYFNNKKENLREATKQQNQFNKKANYNSTSKYKGVCWDKRRKKWLCGIYINGKLKNIGGFNDEILAAKYYDVFANYYFKEFARLNFPEEQLLNNVNVIEIINKIDNRKYASKYIGVCYHKYSRSWRARLTNNKKTKMIGYFKTEKEAAIAYNIEAQKFGYKLNIIEED